MNGPRLVQEQKDNEGKLHFLIKKYKLGFRENVSAIVPLNAFPNAETVAFLFNLNSIFERPNSIFEFWKQNRVQLSSDGVCKRQCQILFLSTWTQVTCLCDYTYFYMAGRFSNTEVKTLCTLNVHVKKHNYVLNPCLRGCKTTWNF